LYKRKIFPLNINLLCRHVFIGARHAVPLPGGPVEFSSFGVLATGMRVYRKKSGE
jgi:hypothetical protein